MGTWQENLFSNLLVVFILVTLVAIVYCKVKKITMVELFKEIREVLSPSEALE